MTGERSLGHQAFPLAVGISVLMGLYLISLYNYLLFHSLAEIFSIVVACSIFVIAWNARDFLDNGYLLFIGIAYLFVGGLDLVHTLAYKGMGVFAAGETNLATQLWISARYTESLSLLLAPLLLRRKPNVYFVLLAYAAAFCLILFSIFGWDVFPVCFLEGKGLTAFKKGSEYVICLILLGSIALLIQHSREFDRGVLRWLVASIVLTIASELAFTFYVHAYGLSNLVGHFFKILSFYFIYKALIETGLGRPYRLLFRSLKKSEESLETTLEESRQRQKEVSALLQAARAVLNEHEFQPAAQAIFRACKESLGAPSGYIALSSRDGSHNEVVFLDSGGSPCTVPEDAPMPIRGLREEVYRQRRTVFHNDFMKSPHAGFLPPGHVGLQNVLFAPLMIREQVVGLLGISNKPGGFDENDARIASAFGELAAIALLNARTLESLADNEERLRSVVETANDAIVSVNQQGRIVFWNPSAKAVFGYTAEEAIGSPVELILPERFQDAHQKGMGRAISAGPLRSTGKTLEFMGRRKEGGEFPIELSLARWDTRNGTFFTGIIRDISDRKEAEESLRRAHGELEERVKERTNELMAVNEQLIREIEERRWAERALRESERRLRLLSSQLMNVQENERKRVARELHDGIGQMLTALKFRLENTLTQVIPEPGARRRSLETTLPMIHESIEEVRRIQMDLRPSILDDLGIVATLGWFCREFQKSYPTISVDRQIEVAEEEISPALKTVIYRVMQEAMNNAAKHSRSERIHLMLHKLGGAIELAVRDYGQGFDRDRAPRGFGLHSMRERTELSGGSFEVSSAPGDGATIRARWPLSPE